MILAEQQVAANFPPEGEKYNVRILSTAELKHRNDDVDISLFQAIVFWLEKTGYQYLLNEQQDPEQRTTEGDLLVIEIFQIASQERNPVAVLDFAISMFQSSVCAALSRVSAVSEFRVID